MTCAFVGFDFQNPNLGFQSLWVQKCNWRIFLLEDAWRLWRKRKSAVNHWRLGSNIAWLSCSYAPFPRYPLEATVRDGIVEKCPDRAVLMLPALTGEHCRCRVFLHKEGEWPVAWSVFCAQFCSALLFFIASCPAPSLSRTRETINIVHWWISNIFFILLIPKC